MKCVITVSGQKIPYVSKVLLQIFYCNILKYRCLSIELNFSIVPYYQRKGLPRWCSGKKSTCQFRRFRSHSWVGKIPWSMKWQPTLVFLPGKFQGQRSLMGYSLWGHKELETTVRLSMHAHIQSKQFSCWIK